MAERLAAGGPAAARARSAVTVSRRCTRAAISSRNTSPASRETGTSTCCPTAITSRPAHDAGEEDHDTATVLPGRDVLGRGDRRTALMVHSGVGGKRSDVFRPCTQLRQAHGPLGVAQRSSRQLREGLAR